MNSTALQLREQILRISNSSGHGHIPTCFSIVEMLQATYDCMRFDPARPDWDQRDIFILSKGHASLALYVTLAQRGFFPMQEVYTFGKHLSRFGCHADRLKVPGVEASTGSLGHGIGLAVGMALAFKIAKNTRRAFTLIGDGESNEGTVWEAVMVAVDQKLSNLTILYDHNKSQGRCLQIRNPAERFAAFGCVVSEVPGHDLAALTMAIQRPRTQEAPHVIVADTVKGYGAKSLLDDPFAWHRRSPKETELAQLLEEIHVHANAV